MLFDALFGSISPISRFFTGVGIENRSSTLVVNYVTSYKIRGRRKRDLTSNIDGSCDSASKNEAEAKNLCITANKFPWTDI
jgi:hypothetical protein